MRIISTNYNNSTSFRGVFIGNELLDKSIERASDYHVHKFANVLERMSKVDDGKEFYLDNYFFPGYFANRQDIKLVINTQYKKFDVKKVGTEEIKKREKSTGGCFDNVIKNVTEILEEIYPEPETTRAKRENSLRRINKHIS